VLHTFAGHQNIVTGVVFSPNNLVLASTSLDKTIKLWRVSDGKFLRTLQGTSPVNSVAFSPNGSLLLAGFEDGTTELWDVSTIK
jgi:WD40 repeat protein